MTLVLDYYILLVQYLSFKNHARLLKIPLPIASLSSYCMKPEIVLICRIKKSWFKNKLEIL